MRAIEISEPGDPDALRQVERPLPQPQPGEIRIAIAAAGVNGADLAQRRGAYPPPKGASDIPGLEVSGVVDALGPAVSGLALGDRLCAVIWRGYAQYCTVPAGQVLPLPASST